MTAPDNCQEITSRLLRGYQFSESDRDSRDWAALYTTLKTNFTWFQIHLGYFGFSLQSDEDVFFLEKEGKVLSSEEKQTVVVLYLLADLWMEKGKTYGDLFELHIPWRDLDWFRDGYGREYLAQVGLEATDGISKIEDLWQRLSNKGLVAYYPTTSTITLRRPAERLLNMARRIHNQLTAQETPYETGIE
ncbi:MAG: hypothetical protein KA314_28645 [Chloroflexi bacterium]|nr:hypothetical protein [Chloroflexota bacterium]MBP8059826.1 hypothetical protein [Chloroflexota bacterium]